MSAPRDDSVYLGHIRDAIGRDKLVHDYMGVDLEAVWETATSDVPRLKAHLAQAEGCHNGAEA